MSITELQWRMAIFSVEDTLDYYTDQFGDDNSLLEIEIYTLLKRYRAGERPII